MMQYDIRPENLRSCIEKTGMRQRSEPAGGIILHVVGVDDDRILGSKPVHRCAFPFRIHVLAAALKLRDNPVEIDFQFGNFPGGKDVLVK